MQPRCMPKLNIMRSGVGDELARRGVLIIDYPFIIFRTAMMPILRYIHMGLSFLLPRDNRQPALSSQQRTRRLDDGH